MLTDLFPWLECYTWRDTDSDCLRCSVQGLRFSVFSEELLCGAVTGPLIISGRVAKAVTAITEGLHWLGGIWDVQWALSHGDFDGEVLW